MQVEEGEVLEVHRGDHLAEVVARGRETSGEGDGLMKEGPGGEGEQGHTYQESSARTETAHEVK